jgi:hypothetical protein
MDDLLQRMMLHPEDEIPGNIIRRCFPNSKEFPPLVRKSEAFDVPDGIIADLTRQCGGNVHDCQIVTVTSSPQYRGNSPEKTAAQNVADLATESTFRLPYCARQEDTHNGANSWIRYDFKNLRIMPTHYAVRSHASGWGFAHLKSWVVEISVDGKHWTLIDSRNTNAELNNPVATRTYPVAASRPCRFIKVSNVGPSHSRYDSLVISGWEIFGSLLEPDETRKRPTPAPVANASPRSRPLRPCSAARPGDHKDQ